MTTTRDEHSQDLAYLLAGADTLADHSGCFEPEAVQPPMRSCPMEEIELDADGNIRGE